MAQIPTASLPLVTPATGRISLEWYAALQRIAQGVAPDLLAFNRNGYAAVVDPPDSYGANAFRVVGTTAAAGYFTALAFMPGAADIRIGFLVFSAFADGFPDASFSKNAAAVTAFSEAAWTENVSHPVNIRFETTAVGAASRTERLRIQADGMLRFQAPSFTANGAGAVTITALRPAGAATATITRWLTFVDEAGVDSYVPVWQ